MRVVNQVAAIAGLLALGASAAQARESGLGSATDLARAISREIDRTLPTHLAVMSVVPDADLRLPAKAQLTLDWRSPPRRGSALVAVTIRSARRPPQHGWARIELAEVRTVPVVRMPLPRGHRLERDDLELGRAPAGPHTLTTLEAVVGATLLEDVPAGAALTRHQITPAPPVARGSMVRVQVRRGLVMLTTSGILERDVRVGEIGGARLEGNGQRIVGRLVDANTMLVGGES